MNKIAILIPTYNEAVSIVELLEKLKDFRKIDNKDFDVIVIDDNSPDGTAEIVDNLHLDWVSILRRPGKGGLGAAYRAGFAVGGRTRGGGAVRPMGACGVQAERGFLRRVPAAVEQGAGHRHADVGADAQLEPG